MQRRFSSSAGCMPRVAGEEDAQTSGSALAMAESAPLDPGEIRQATR
jgi:hypothetical protein